ncbi:MAG: Fic family protein [bacterium]|nr:Fic family protein [bacterium]
MPAQLVNLTSNIAALKVLSAERRRQFEKAYSELERIARIESVKASNAIEGIVTTDARLAELMQNGTAPLNHSEAEISGYRDALNEIHVNPQLHDFTEREILSFYRQLVRYAEPGTDVQYKVEDNVIAERMPDGRRVVRFTPASAVETPEAMKQLVLAYQVARDDVEINKLLLIPCVILDFLCIHPFADGNGRMSRLLTLLLLYRNGFDAGKYISFEQRINDSKLAYYTALRESSVGWETNENRPFPFIINFLMTLYSCYQELDRRFAVVNSGHVTKTARIEHIVLNSLTPIAKSDICRALPDISPTTVESVLGAMVRRGAIRKIGNGRGVKYIR